MNDRAGGGGRKVRGVAVGVVTNINDPLQWGRVKVQLPWLDDQVESHWARVTGWYAGNSRGTMYIPEVGDEVLVSFEGGDPNHPYVLGAVFNGKHAVPGPGNPDGKNDHKWFRSRAGHDLEFLDSDGAEKIRIVDSSTNNSVVFDTAADTITTEAKTGTINIQAPKGLIRIECVDLKMTTSQGRVLEVGTTHTVTVGATRTVSVQAGNFVELAGSSMTVTSPSMETSCKSAVGVSAGAMVMNQGQISTDVGEWSEVQQGPVTRTVGSQTISTGGFMTSNMAGDLSGTFTLLAGSAMSSAKGGFLVNGGPVTLMGGLVNAKAGSMVVAKDGGGAKAALSTWLGGLLLLNPNALTFPATKLLDPIMGLDFHTTLPAPLVPPLPPIPFFPTPFMGPILIDFKATVLINFLPAAGSGATALGFHMPPLPWLWPPISHRPLITAAIMALITAPFTAMLEMARGKMVALAAASGNPTFQRGFVADFIGSSHVPPADQTAQGTSYSPAGGDQGSFSFTRLFPMFGSPGAFLGFLAGLLPLPIANASVAIASPTVTVCDTPLGLMIPMGAKSCSDIPVVPNAMVLGFSNVLTGMSIGDFLGALAWNMLKDGATAGFQAGLKGAGNAAARRIAKSNNPRLQNVAQKVNDFVGGENCIAEGHPVDVVSGTVFTEATDFTLFSAQNLVFRRFYNSRAEHLPTDPSGFGPGWRHDFDEVLIADESTDGVRTLALRNREGRILGFDLPLVDGGTDFHPGERLTLTRIDGRTWEVRDINDTVRVFEFSGEGKAPPSYQPPPGKQARLAAVRTPEGGAGHRFYWEKNRLTGFADAAGRVVQVKQDHQGRIAELRLIQSGGQDCDIFLAGYRYDGDGRLIAHIDRNRNLRWYRYDAQNRLIRETDRNGYSFHFHYDAQGRCSHTYGDDNAFWCAFSYDGKVTTVTDALGGVTRYGFNDAALVTSAIDALGGVSTTEYTAEGWKQKVTDPNGCATELKYDDRGRVVEATDPTGAKTSWRHEAGRNVERIDALGNTWRLDWTDTRLAAVRSPLGHTTLFERDAEGRVISITRPDGALWRRTYGADGLVREDEHADGRRIRYTCDALGRVTELEERVTTGETRKRSIHRDAEGRVTGIDGSGNRRERFSLMPEGQPVVLEVGHRKATRRYEGWGRLVEHTDPLGRTTRVAWDVHHQITSIRQPGDRVWGYQRDRLGRVATMTTPDGLRVHYVSDPGGRVIEEQRPDRTIQRTYDRAGRPTRIDWGRGGETRLGWDALGRLVRIEGKGPSGDDRPIDRAYDADGRLATETQGDEFVRWRHDALGRPTRRSTSWGARDLFHWKINGLNGLVDPLGGEHSFQHDAWSRRLTWRQAGGLEQTTRYDDLDRLVADQLRVPGGDVFVDRRLVWGEDDTVTHEEQRTARGVKRLEYQYDAAGRLLGRAANDGPPVSFEYDVCDNLTTDSDGTKRTYRADRLLGDDAGQAYRHDATGRMVARQGREGTLRLWFDDRDRLVRVHTGDNRVVHHRYDALGRRVETLAEQPDGQVTEETFYWDDDQLARRVVRRPQTRQVERDERYTYDPERPHIPLFRVVHGGEATETTGEIQYYTTDQRGAAVRLSAADGKALWAAEYDPYGRLQRLEGDEPQPIRLMGQLHDEASDLSHHRYRVFDPQAARFISPDPLGLVGGANAFGYPTDPVAWADPLGLAKCSQAVIDDVVERFPEFNTPAGRQQLQIIFDNAFARDSSVVLGGSRVRGNAGPGSDVDVGFGNPAVKNQVGKIIKKANAVDGGLPIEDRVKIVSGNETPNIPRMTSPEEFFMRSGTRTEPGRVGEPFFPSGYRSYSPNGDVVQVQEVRPDGTQTVNRTIPNPQ